MNSSYLFRVWNPKESKMVFFSFSDLKNIDWLKDLNFSDDFPIMQIVNGCFDKEARAIYEGDILENYKGKVFDVKKYNGSFVIFTRVLNEGGDDEPVYLADFLTKDFKIIGNIVENSELLVEPVNEEIVKKL